MSRLTGFVRRERLYILLLVLVTIISILAMPAQSDKVNQDTHRLRKAASISFEASSTNDRQAVERALAGNTYLASMFMIVSLLALVIFLLGIVIDCSIFASGYKGRFPCVTINRIGNVRWTLWDVVKVVTLYLFFGYMLIITEAFLIKVSPAIAVDNFRMILNSSIMDILTVIFIIYFTVGQYDERIDSLGLTAKNFFRNVYYGIVAYIALVPVMIAIVAATAIVINVTKYVPHVQPVVSLFLEEKNARFLLYTGLFAAIAGPVIEEIFFRGFLYNAVKKYVGVFWAILITAAMFAGLHAHIIGFMPILALGILLAYLYEKTGSLVSSMTVHMVHNLGMVVLVFLVKQLGVYR